MEASNNKYPCHINPTISGEQFIAEHIFIFIKAGTMTIFDEAGNEHHLQPGDYCFARRNSLARYLKKSPENGRFESVALFFSQDFLRSFGREYRVSADCVLNKNAIIKLDPHPLFANYVQSRNAYKGVVENEDIMALKNKEIILILLKTNPELRNLLFDFTDPDKIDLATFMTRNFRFNVSLQRFGYLTGRSLTSFKRDFEKTFHMAPGRWLLEKRLNEARFLIEKNGAKPSEVYLEVGFEDLSHFSFAFKKMFGISPNQLKSLQMA
ncbi:helix-turn-helix domain-containing protein [Dyadobacter psychrotolerans]|uniref:AraC family transcriptional regulator n=1 Tax=Dyadobacter psychrotolerans TaxID=2541721 RepID=A0A4R5DKH9_9BACT|nr:AraC family transcriptional regulator [Dyadobacter psychrotolerans]TDE14682.1 AraC family transcriptional regulator [Dyadobacter psychrotolerans]